MNRSFLPALRAGFSRLPWHRDNSQSRIPGATTLADRRRIDRRRHVPDLRYREFRLEAAAQAGGVGVYDLDWNTGSNYWSPELKAIAGLPAEPADMSLEAMAQIVHPEDRVRVMQKVEAALDPGGDGRFEDEYRLVRPDGTARWVKARGQTFFSGQQPERHVLGASGIVVDITELRSVERSLREQSEELRLALRVGNSGTFQWNARTHQHRWCNEMLTLYGLKREEFGGQDEDWLACIVPEDREPALAAVERSLKTGEYSAEFRIRRRSDGEIRWLVGRGQVTFDAQGDPERMVGINIDTTEQKREHAESEENRLRLAAILDNLTEGVVVFDLSGQVTQLNPAALRLMRYSTMAEARLRLPEFAHAFEVLDQEGRPLPLEEWPIGRVIRGESFTHYEVEVRRKDDGTSTIISHNGALVRGPDGETILGVLTLLDVTERKQTEQALRRKQKRLAGLVGAAMDAIISVDAQQRVVMFNAAAEKMFLCSAAEARGKSIEQFLPERYRADHHSYVKRFLAEGTTARKMGQLQSLWGLRANGEKFPLEASISKIDVDGTWLATVILRDITERYEAEQALRESREQLALALQVGRSGAFDWDTQADVKHWSDESLALYGLKREEFGGSYEEWLANVHPADREAVSAAVRESLKTGVFALEFRIRRRDNGEIRWLQSRGEVFFDAEGRPRRMVGINIDITEKKRLEEELQRMNETLERRVAERTAALARSNEELLKSNEELQRFAYIASHDLQTPLRAITSCSQLLQRDYRGQLGARADNLIERVVGATHRMQTLILDLLAYSRIDSQARPFQPTDFGQVFDAVLATQEATLHETGARITRSDLPVVYGDRSQLTQLLQNLIENGIKYHGADPPHVHVSAELRGDSWLFSVRDNGIGIPADQREAVFELFRRLHTHQAYPGTGIGLAVCRRVVERHGGRIWMESEPGKGSVFHFTLPHCQNGPEA